MTSRSQHALAIAVGAASALSADRLASRAAPGHEATGHTVGLAVAAAIYPVARTGGRGGGAAVRELVALAAYAGVTAWALRTGSATGRRVAAAGWASHALFDAAHDTGPDSRIPSWYPALCAGYDVAVAGLLLRD